MAAQAPDTWQVSTERTLPMARGAFVDHGHVGLWNGSDDTIEVLAVDILSPSGSRGLLTTAVMRAGAYGLYRISSMAGGTPLAVLKHDTAAAALPGGVSIMLRPDSVVLGDLIRQQGDSPGINTINAASAPMDSGGGAGIARAGFAYAPSWLIGFVGDGAVQPIQLREGQGLAVIMATCGQPHLQTMAVRFANVATGETYTVWVPDASAAGGDAAPIVAILNQSGTGMILAVVAIDLIDVGHQSNDSTAASSLRAAFLGRPPADGTALAAVPFDPASAPLAAGLVLRKDFTWPYGGGGRLGLHLEVADVDTGVILGSADIPVALALTGLMYSATLRGHVVMPARGGTPTVAGFARPLYRAGSGQGIVLRKGEGFGYVAGVPMGRGAPQADWRDQNTAPKTFDTYDLVVTFKRTPAVVATLAGIGYTSVTLLSGGLAVGKVEVTTGWTAPLDFRLSAGTPFIPTPFDPTGMTVALILRDANGTQLPNIAISLNADGSVRYSPAASDLDGAKSPYSAHWKVTDAAGEVAFFPSGAPTAWVVRPV
jgi:hypothetical protein